MLQPSPRWLKRRKLTTIAFAFQNFILGMEYSLTFLTLYLYITDTLNTSKPKLFYSLVSVSYLLSNVLMCLLFGRAIDKYRNTRESFLLCNGLMVIGNILYSVPHSPWCLVAGRFLSGVAGPIRTIISGEIVRSYPSSTVNEKLSIIAMAFSAGFIFGPTVNFAFKSVDVWIYGWHVTYTNVPGLYMATLCLLMEILTLFMVFNLSQEFDWKENERREKCDENKPMLDENRPILDEERVEIEIKASVEKESLFQVAKMLFTNIDSALMLFLSFFSLLFMLSFDIWLPILVVDVMQWTITEINLIVFSSGVIVVVVLLAYIWKPLSNQQVFTVTIFALLSIVAMELIFIVLKKYHANIAIDIILLALYALSFAGLGIMADVFFISALGKMVNSDMQASVESLRLAMSRAGALLALSTAAQAFDYIEAFGSVYIAIIIVEVTLLFVRRESFKNPKVLF